MRTIFALVEQVSAVFAARVPHSRVLVLPDLHQLFFFISACEFRPHRRPAHPFAAFGDPEPFEFLLSRSEGVIERRSIPIPTNIKLTN